jgi:murein DD-endopeptidase MepM/ murein hydrolase activator NlpD
VGSTGLATGPHLCYRFWKNGVQVDALRVELPASEPIKAEYKAAYEEAKAAVMMKLDGIASPVQQSFAKVL